jgi:DNA ligase-1
MINGLGVVTRADPVEFHAMLRFAEIGEKVAATTKKLEKVALVAGYLQSLPPDEAAIAAVFFSGRPFASYRETTLQVGGALLWRSIAERSGKPEAELTASYRRHGDAGAVAADVLPARPEAVLSLGDVQSAFERIAAARGPASKAALLQELMRQATPLEAKYIVKIVSGDLRIGLKESLVEEAIAKAFNATRDEVKRANMLLGDLGETARLAELGKLSDASMRIFHPIDFMLASPVESAVETSEWPRPRACRRCS